MGDYTGLWIGIFGIVGAFAWAGIYYLTGRVNHLQSRNSQLTSENYALRIVSRH